MYYAYICNALCFLNAPCAHNCMYYVCLASEDSDPGFYEGSPTPPAPLIPMDGLEPDAPPRADPSHPYMQWWSYRHECASVPTPMVEDFFALAMDAVLKTFSRLLAAMHRIAERMRDNTEEWQADYEERAQRLGWIAEHYFGGNNIANLFGQLVVANLVRPWEAPMLTTMLAYRLVPVPRPSFDPDHVPSRYLENILEPPSPPLVEHWHDNACQCHLCG